MFRGVGTALITPFLENYEVDYDALRHITRFQIANGVDALVIIGTTGEAPVINFSEREKIISTVVDEADGRAKIIVGTGTNDTQHVLEMNKQAEQFDIDGVLIVNPYYNKGTQESLIAHYGYIAERISLPILLYNVPSRTGMNILPETAVKIHELFTNVVGIKEASGNISQIAKLIAIKPNSFSVFSGNDDQTLPILALGAEGEISVFSNAFPSEKVKLIDALLNEDYETARDLQNKHNRLNNLLFVETSPAPIKYLMSELGFCKNILRLPLLKVTGRTESLIREEIGSNYNDIPKPKKYHPKKISLHKVL
jgi:4-hydroxy-tetrahydrodipicolinate synthase